MPNSSSASTTHTITWNSTTSDTNTIDFQSMYPAVAYEVNYKPMKYNMWREVVDKEGRLDFINGKCHKCNEHKEVVIKCKSIVSSDTKWICEKCL